MRDTVSAEIVAKNTFLVRLPDRTNKITGLMNLRRLLGAYGVNYSVYDEFKAELLETGKASRTMLAGKASAVARSE